MTAPLEIEFKLAIAPGDVERLRAHPHLREVSLGPAQTRPLDNRYFDTPDHLLAQNAMALRLRRDGERWVQTLKTAGHGTGAMSTRHEWEMPVAGPRLELARLARTPLARLRPMRELAASLAPRYATDFTRELRTIACADGTRAEFAIDIGEVIVDDAHGRRTAPICEVEVELLEGEPRTLLRLVQTLARDIALVPCFDSKAARGDALADRRNRQPVKMPPVAPAADQPVAQALAQALTAGLRCLIANLPSAIDPAADPEFVHLARVALRRMRSLLQAHRTVLDHPHRLDELDRHLRTLAHALGAARDWDVFCDSTLALLNEPGPATGEDAVRAALMPALTAMAHKHRAAAHDALWKHLVSRRFSQAMLAIEAMALELSDAQGPTCSAAARRVLEAEHRRAVARARGLAGDDAAGLHRLRLDVKRLRYVFDFYTPLYGAEQALPYALALAALQTRLGRLNDLAVAARLLATVGRATAPERLWQAQLARMLDRHRPKLATHVMELRAAPRVWMDGAHRS